MCVTGREKTTTQMRHVYDTLSAGTAGNRREPFGHQQMQNHWSEATSGQPGNTRDTRSCKAGVIDSNPVFGAAPTNLRAHVSALRPATHVSAGIRCLPGVSRSATSERFTAHERLPMGGREQNAAGAGGLKADGRHDAAMALLDRRRPELRSPLILVR